MILISDIGQVPHSLTAGNNARRRQSGVNIVDRQLTGGVEDLDDRSTLKPRPTRSRLAEYASSHLSGEPFSRGSAPMSATRINEPVWCVITAHNRRDKTVACIGKVLAQRTSESVEVRVVLVYDGSTDGTSQAVHSSHPDVVIATGDGSLFWAGGMRLGIATAIAHGAECLWLVNDDVSFFDDALETMTAALRSPEAADYEERPWVVGPTHNPEGGTSYSGWRRHGRLRPRDEKLDPVGRPIPCNSANFNSVLLWADQYRVLGGLDPHFVHNAGDNDLAYRATRSGIPLLLAADYVGECGTIPPPMWQGASASLRERFRNLHSVKQHPPMQSLRFNLRHAGIAGVALFLHPYFTISRSILGPPHHKAAER